MTWGPLVVKVVEASAGHGEYCPLAIKTEGTGKHKRRTIAPVWVPDAAHRGEHYRRWVDRICADGGYRFDHRILDSADFGAYTSRRRFFGIFAAGRLPIVFPTPTHAKKPAPNLFDARAKWRPVRDVLDLHDEGASIFGRKKPLVDATFERIHAGLVKFVAGGKEAFMVKYNSMSQSGKYVAPGIDDPCPTVAVQSRLGVAKACFLAKHFSGSPADRAISIDGPAHAITTVDHHALVSGNFLTAYYGNGYNSPVEAPGPTVTTKDRFQLVQPRFLNMQYGNGGAVSVEEPAGTVTTTPKHHLVTCRLGDPRPQGSLSAESAIHVQVWQHRNAVLYVDRPHGQNIALHRHNGARGSAGRSVYPPRGRYADLRGIYHRQPDRGADKGVHGAVRAGRCEDANVEDSRTETHHGFPRQLQAGRHTGRAEEVHRATLLRLQWPA